MTAQEDIEQMAPEGCTQADWDEYCTWFERRGILAPSPSLCPPHAFLRLRHAAGWVLTTDADLAIVEGIATDPGAPPGERWVDLTELHGLLKAYAASKDKTRLLFLPSRGRLEELCKSLGFEKLGEHATYGQRLTQESRGSV
jgi:hypothetical protein